MKLIPKASLAFKSLKPAEKPTFGNKVINALSPALQAKQKAQASVFSDLPVPVADLQTINDALSEAVSEALTGKHTALYALKSAVADWNAAFTTTANYITTVAAGDATIISGAGFTPTKSESTPMQKPGAITGFNATINGSKGAIIASSKTAVPDACTYLYFAIPDGITVTYNGNAMVLSVDGKSIYIMPDTHKQTEFCNMPSGVPYNVSAFAVNRAGSGPAATSKQVIPQ